MREISFASLLLQLHNYTIITTCPFQNEYLVPLPFYISFYLP